MSHGRSSGYDPKVFSLPAARHSLISSGYMVAHDVAAMHALRHRNQDKFLFLLETLEEKTCKAIEVSFPKPPDTNISGWNVVDEQPRRALVCPTTSIYPENKIHDEIREFRCFASHSITLPELSDLVKLFSEIKKENVEYNFNSSTRDEQIKVLNSILEPIYRIVPFLQDGIGKFPTGEKKSGCAIS